MSDTPRTDASQDDLLYADTYTAWLQMSQLARKLERELNQAIKERDEFQRRLDSFWIQVRREFDIEDRNFFEKEAPASGDWTAEAMAVHHIWKRDPFVEELAKERDALKTDRDAFKREFLKAVEACSFMQNEPEFSHLLGESSTSSGVLFLKKQRDENKAGWDRASLVALRLERERNEARECLREAYTGAGSLVTPDKTLARWRKAAGLEPS